MFLREIVITYPEALQWLFALTLPPLRAPSPLPMGEERGLSRRLWGSGEGEQGVMLFHGMAELLEYCLSTSFSAQGR